LRHPTQVFSLTVNHNDEQVRAVLMARDQAEANLTSRELATLTAMETGIPPHDSLHDPLQSLCTCTEVYLDTVNMCTYCRYRHSAGSGEDEETSATFTAIMSSTAANGPYPSPPASANMDHCICADVHGHRRQRLHLLAPTAPATAATDASLNAPTASKMHMTALITATPKKHRIPQQT
jgi:hypothetical protein